MLSASGGSTLLTLARQHVYIQSLVKLPIRWCYFKRTWTAVQVTRSSAALEGGTKLPRLPTLARQRVYIRSLVEFQLRQSYSNRSSPAVQVTHSPATLAGGTKHPTTGGREQTSNACAAARCAASPPPNRPKRKGKAILKLNNLSV